MKAKNRLRKALDDEAVIIELQISITHAIDDLLTSDYFPIQDQHKKADEVLKLQNRYKILTGGYFPYVR